MPPLNMLRYVLQYARQPSRTGMMGKLWKRLIGEDEAGRPGKPSLRRPSNLARDAASCCSLGDAGCNAASTWRRLAGNADIVLFNTDARTLQPGSSMRCVQLGMHVTNGLGAGGNPNAGRRAADAELPAIRDVFAQAGFVLLVCGMGGGTGSGAASLLAHEARRAGGRVIGIAIMPFEFEGRRRMDQAERGLRALRDAADVVACLHNQRLFEIAGTQAGVPQAYEVSHEMLGNSLLGLAKVIAKTGLITLDFPDFASVLEGAVGNAVLASVESSGPGAVDDALKAVAAHPLLLNGQSLQRAASLMISAIAGPDLKLGDLDRLLRGVQALAPEDTVISTGLAVEQDWADRILLTLLAVERFGPGRALQPARAAPAPLRERNLKRPGGACGQAPEKLRRAGLFDLGQSSPGRFKAELTIHEGHNLDIPTFLRRGICFETRPAGKTTQSIHR